MRNLSRISHYWNRVEAWNDWNELADEVSAAGFDHLVEKHRLAEDASWRKIDKANDALRAAYDLEKAAKGESEA